MTFFKRFVNVFLLIALLSSCNPSARDQKISFLGETQGTYYSIIYFDKEGRDLQGEIDSLLMAFDLSASIWKPHSIISRVNNNDTVTIDTWFKDIFRVAYQVSEETNGAFDMTVGPLVNAWGFGFAEKQDPDMEQIDSLLQYVNYQSVRVEGNHVIKKNPNIRIDFNAIAQGYSVEVIASFLSGQGIHNFLVDIGGEVYASGEKPGGIPWKVGIERPAESKDDPREIQVKVTLTDKALATSGSYRKYYVIDSVRYPHTIDPATGYPVRHSLLSVSVMTDNCALADAYATAFMVMGVDKAKLFLTDHPELQAFFISSTPEGEFSIYATKGFWEYVVE